jgi:hypothetical protein
MNRESLLDTIRRLLALSESPNEHEAARAAAKAAELMSQHNIELAQLETPPEHDWFEEDAGEERQRVTAEQPIIANILKAHFFVVPIFLRRERSYGSWVTVLSLFGERHNVAVARYVGSYLRDTFRRLAKQARIQTKGRRSYFLGLAQTVGAKLEAQRQKSVQVPGGERALVVLEADTKKAFDERYPDIEKLQSRASFDDDSFIRGLRDGEQISINPAIGRGDRTPIGAAQLVLPSR